jgi:pimeloyl-ACP methyl ester carboxylesterase
MWLDSFAHIVAPSLLLIILAREATTTNNLPRSVRHQYSRDTNMASTSNVTINAHNFELSYRAHPSVAEDPFYTVPHNSTEIAPGTLLKVERETNTSFYTLAPNLSLSRFMYQSKTSDGTLVPVSAYVLWPYIARDYGDGLPMVAWAHGTSGTNDECAPSNIQNLWHHFQAPYQLALLGYVVVATDYAGLGVGADGSGKFIVHEYLNGLAQANDVAYSIPAAQKAFPELSKKFVVIGSSEGGLAAWGFAEKLVSEPMDGHLGTVALSPVTRVLNLPATEAVIPQLLLMIAPSLIANFPSFKPEQIFTPEGQQSLETYVALKGCNTVLFNIQSTNILKDGWQNNTWVQEYQQVAAVGGKCISGAMLVIQGGIDPIVYPQSVTDAINETMKADPSAKIEYHLLPNVSHAPAMYAGLQIYLDWIAERFSGQAVKPGFSRFEPRPVRPAAAQQLEANWFIQNETEPWQAT